MSLLFHFFFQSTALCKCCILQLLKKELLSETVEWFLFIPLLVYKNSFIKLQREPPKIVHLPKLLRQNISCIAMHGVSQQPKSFLCVFQKEPAVLAFLFTSGSREGFISVHVDKNCPISLEIFEKYSDDDLFDPLVYCPHHPFAACSCSRLLGRPYSKAGSFCSTALDCFPYILPADFAVKTVQIKKILI